MGQLLLFPAKVQASMLYYRAGSGSPLCSYTYRASVRRSVRPIRESEQAMRADTATPVLTIDEVRSRLNVSISTVRRLVRDGKLRAYRVGGGLRFKPEELAAYVDSQLVATTIPEPDTPSS